MPPVLPRQAALGNEEGPAGVRPLLGPTVRFVSPCKRVHVVESRTDLGDQVLGKRHSQESLLVVVVVQKPTNHSGDTPGGVREVNTNSCSYHLREKRKSSSCFTLSQSASPPPNISSYPGPAREVQLAGRSGSRVHPAEADTQIRHTGVEEAEGGRAGGALPVPRRIGVIGRPELPQRPRSLVSRDCTTTWAAWALAYPDPPA